ncbi:MAG: glycosyltransferase [Patescibacteria group bacterium]
MKIALVHDFLREYGGAERVVETLHEMWPEAPLYTSFVDWGNLGDQGYRFKNWDIRTSWVQQFWFIKKFISPLRFLAPWIWGSFDLSGYDVVISSSGWFICRGVRMGDPSTRSARSGRALHVCYIHHPPRNLYGYATGSDLQKYWIVRVYAAIVNFFLRHYDYETAQKVDYFIANSQETKRRVLKFYRRDAAVIYPPIELSNYPIIQLSNNPIKIHKKYYLSVGRLTYSKRVDIAIAACKKLGLPLMIVGTGKEEESLKKLASQGLALRSCGIEFLGSVNDEELSRLYAGAKALIFCALDEDFGMVPVEAMAHGTPVIALAQGGVVETVVDGKTGILFHEVTVESLIKALGRFRGLGGFGEMGENCIKQAEKFGKERFKKELLAFINTQRFKAN